MITNFKIYENKNEITVGDYILVYVTESSLTDEGNDYINSHVGVVIDQQQQEKLFKLDYDEIKAIWVFHADIIYHSKNKEDVETKIQTNKYNL